MFSMVAYRLESTIASRYIYLINGSFLSVHNFFHSVLFFVDFIHAVVFIFTKFNLTSEKKLSVFNSYWLFENVPCFSGHHGVHTCIKWNIPRNWRLLHCLYFLNRHFSVTNNTHPLLALPTIGCKSRASYSTHSYVRIRGGCAGIQGQPV